MIVRCNTSGFFFIRNIFGDVLNYFIQFLYIGMWHPDYYLKLNKSFGTVVVNFIKFSRIIYY